MSRRMRAGSRVALLAAFPLVASVLGGEARAQDHSAHREALAKAKRYARTLERYALPPVTLIDQDGAEIDFLRLIDSSQPIALNFIFSTCTTICPVMSATFGAMRRDLGEERGALRLVSLTIDPEYDTPEVMREYAQKWRADPEWRFLTGSLEDIVAVQKGFDAYAGSKMNHRALTFFKATGAEEWVRIDGLASAADLAREYRSLESP